MTLSVSRRLLLPGPEPPLSHFGITLLRHAVATGLRYSLYQLGLNPPDRPPVRIVALRLYLDGPALAEKAAGRSGTGRAELEVLAALTSPQGTAATAWWRSPVAGSALFHRSRLRLHRRRVASAATAATIDGASPQRLWQLFRLQLRAELPRLNDALLGEILAAMDRRRRRARGATITACLGREAWRLRAGRHARLSHLGPPDLLHPSWVSTPTSADVARSALAGQPLPSRHRLRGGFREAWRAALDRLRVPFLALAGEATANGLLSTPEDAFFLPFDLGHELTGDERPAWLPAALAANRREYEAQLDRPSPPEVVLRQTVSLGGSTGPATWIAAPLSPLQ